MSNNRSSGRDSDGQKPSGIDLHVGCRIRKLREAAGFTVQKLAAESDTEFETLVAMESGRRRVSAQALVAIACVLDIGIITFFLDM